MENNLLSDLEILEEEPIFPQDPIIQTSQGRKFVQKRGKWFFCNTSGTMTTGVEAGGCLGMCSTSVLISGKGSGRLKCSKETCYSGLSFGGVSRITEKMKKAVKRFT